MKEAERRRWLSKVGWKNWPACRPTPRPALMRLHRHGTDLALDVRCAFSWHARMRGLLGVSEAALARAGLWLRPCGAVHTLGMVCAIDVVFLDREGVVKKVVASLPPGRWAVARGAHSVLELHAGATLRAGIYPGDRLHVLPR